VSDLDLLERFRAEVPEPDDASIHAAEAVFRARVGTGPGAMARRRRRWTIPVGVAAAAVTLALALPTVLPIGGPGGPDPAAASILLRFSQIAAHAHAEEAPAPGQYVYTKTLEETSFAYASGDGKHRFVYQQRDTQQRWLGTDGSGRSVTESDDATFRTDADHAAFEAWVAAGGPAADDAASLFYGETDQERFPPGEGAYRDTSTLPTNVQALRKLIEDRQIVGGPDGDWETFVLATDLIRDSYARPALRAALYQVMAGLSGIEVVGKTTDAAGRDGIGLASTHDGYRNDVVFDARTAKILEERTVNVGNEDEGLLHNPGSTSTAYAPVGQTVYVSTYLSFGDVVNSLTQVPAPNG
jgi:hypothetical protein